MGRSRYKFADSKLPHFVTCTVVNWTPIFTRPQTVNIVLESLHYLSGQGMKVYAYVVLENHLHLVVQSNDLGKDIARFKSYTARRIIDYLYNCKAERILKQLSFYKKAHKQKENYQFWEEGGHPEWIQNIQMLQQKVEYIHQNPVKRGYVDEVRHWRYSSARDYDGMDGVLPICKDWI